MNAGPIPPLASIVVAVEHQPAREFLTDNLTADGLVDPSGRSS